MLDSNRPFPLTAGTRLFFCVAVALLAASGTYGQSILGTNLIVNGDAEQGPAASGRTSIVASIPGWSAAASANVVPYGLTGLLLLTDPAPRDHQAQYFVAGGNNGVVSTLTQDINVSSGASTISAGNVRFAASAYLGSLRIGVENERFTSTVDFAFKNAAGQLLASASLGPLAYFWGDKGLSLQQQIGLVPAATARVTVTLSMVGSFAAADSLSLVFYTAPTVTVGRNLVVNGDSEAGPSAVPPTNPLFVPNWSTTTNYAPSVAPYGGTGWISTTAPGPANRGVSLFAGTPAPNASMYQDADVSTLSALIDVGSVTFEAGAWLGGIANVPSAILMYTFFDWAGKQLAATAQLGPVTHSATSLLQTSAAGSVPAGTRRIHIAVTFPTDRSLADNISLTLATASGPPVIEPGGVISASAFGGFSTVSPGSWIEIFGANLAATTRSWTADDIVNGVAPTSLDGVSVTIGGVTAFLDYISPGQINALVPSSLSTGPQPVRITNGNGMSDPEWLIVNPTEPGLLAPSAFAIGGKQYVVAIFADGAYALPQNAIPGVPSRPAKPGDTVVVYGIGFGPVSTGVAAGTVVTALNSLTTPIQFLFGNTQANLTYDGLAVNFIGLYQFNVVVPNVSPNSALPLTVMLGGVKGDQTLSIAVGN